MNCLFVWEAYSELSPPAARRRHWPYPFEDRVLPLPLCPSALCQSIIAVGSDEEQKDSVFHVWDWEESATPVCSGAVRWVVRKSGSRSAKTHLHKDTRSGLHNIRI